MGLAAAILVPTTPSSAGPPAENHYKVYRESGTEIPALVPLTLADQFGVFDVEIIQRVRFATPASKDSSLIYDDEAHQTWFGIFSAQPQREVTAVDQFGAFTWRLGNAVYLLAPAAKHPQPGDGPPVRNHYVCYEALEGPMIGRSVFVVDQFDAVHVMVVRGQLFCNPVEKRLADGTTYPVVDATAHLTCYTVVDPTTYSNFVSALDQFGAPEMHLVSSDCLCNPASKDLVGIEESTWGRIKSLYRDANR
jgi:hypothetical protein